MNNCTYRMIAKEAGVSIATVSLALRDRPNVSEETRRRIKRIAKKNGYMPNPIVSAMMRQQRRRNPKQDIRAILALCATRRVLDYLKHHSTDREFIVGVEEACHNEGFFCERFYWDDFEETPRRFFARLRSRRVPGVIFIGGHVPDWMGSAGWDSYAMASLGNRSSSFPTHYSAADHYNNAWLCISKLDELGYRNIGLVMARTVWAERSNFKALSAYAGWACQAHVQWPPPLLEKEISRSLFMSWLDKYQPDAIIISESEPLTYLTDAGIKIPDELGVCHLDVSSDWENLSGIQQNNFDAGQAAAHLVIDQINRNTRGMPEHPRSLLIPGNWVQSTSVRKVTPKS
ncbi:MAG: LacI family DNA-binding transcriptional regulator [Verrucomicrobiota bacterium JB024]|nr:LacI family DNA-binding transcriptional regulator [Verrucomicrobiota bacterium JB024]